MQKQAYRKSFLCSECGKPIEGDHVYIKTKRGSELHIHYECMPKAPKKRKSKGLQAGKS